MDPFIEKFIPFFPPAFKKSQDVIFLGSNFYVSVFEVDHTFIFRFANNVSSIPKLSNLHCILNTLISQHVSFSFPIPKFFSIYSSFPFALLIYKKIPGQVLSPSVLTDDNSDSFAQQIASILLQIHSFTPYQFSSCSLSSYIPSEQYFSLIKDKTFSYLSSKLSSDELELLNHFWLDFSKIQQSSTSLYVIHGDFWFGNLLVELSTNHISGVLDFEDLSFGSQMIDFVSLLYFGDTFVQKVLFYYNKSSPHPFEWSGSLSFLYALFREISGLYQGLIAGSVGPDSISKIKKLL